MREVYDSSQSNVAEQIAQADGQVFCSWQCSYAYLDAKSNATQEKYLCTRCRQIHFKIVRQIVSLIAQSFPQLHSEDLEYAT